MKAAIRNVYISIVVILALSCSTTTWGYGHRYDTGLLRSITSNEIVMNGKVYHLKSGLKVILKVKDKKGAYYEHVGRLSDLRQGDRVYLKVFGPNEVLEIEVMR